MVPYIWVCCWEVSRRCEAGACAMPCTPPHGPFNRVQDKNVRGAHSSKLGIEVTKSSFSSNARSLCSPSDPPHHTYHLSDHGATPLNALIIRNPFPRVRTPHTSTAPRAMAHENGTGQPLVGILDLVSSSHTREVTNTRTQASSDPVSTHPNHLKPTQTRPDVSSNQ
jgi:hypothetical protein